MSAHFGVDVCSGSTPSLPEPPTTCEWADVIDDVEGIPPQDRIRMCTFTDPGNDTSDSDTDKENDLCDCGKQCLEFFSKERLRDNELNILEIEKNERELLIMGALQYDTEGKSGKRKRARVTYTFQGVRVCRTAFKHVFNVGDRSLKNIMKHIKENGLVPRVHGNTGRRPTKSLSYADIKQAVDFVCNYAQLNGIPMPAAPKGGTGDAPVYLPASETKKAVHEQYVRCCTEANSRPLGLTAFQDAWRQCLPHIRIASPREDVCQTCELLRRDITKAVTESDKLAAATAFAGHVEVCIYVNVFVLF